VETHTRTHGYGFCMGTGLGFVFKHVYTSNNIELYYLVLKKINDTIENEHKRLVFEDGSGGGGAKEQPPSKTSIGGSFLRMVWWWWCQ